MSDYISREVAIETVCYNCPEANICGGSCDDTDRLRSIPAADVREVRRGKWLSMEGKETVVSMKYGKPQESCKCSVCGEWLAASDEYAVMGNFCPNCGALMEEQT